MCPEEGEGASQDYAQFQRQKAGLGANKTIGSWKKIALKNFLFLLSGTIGAGVTVKKGIAMYLHSAIILLGMLISQMFLLSRS